MTEIKVEIKKEDKKLPPKETGEAFVPQPSMTDVKKERRETLVPLPPKVVCIPKVKKKQPYSLLGLFMIIISLLILGLIVWFGFLTKK